MKVRESVDAKREILSGKRGASRAAGVSGAKQSEFSETLRVTATEAKRGDMADILEELDELAKQLKDSRTLALMKKYREKMQSFLKTAVEQSYELGEERAFDRKGRRRVFLLVKKVNQAVEDLTRMVLDQQFDSLQLLQKLGEIRGMLIDLYT